MKYFLLLVLIILKLSHAESAEVFSTRLGPNLLIAAQECEGSEVVAAKFLGKWSDFNCVPGEFLLIVDDVNTCSESGECTEEAVMPITVKLVKTGDYYELGYDSYRILPSVPVTAEQRWILRTHKINLLNNGEIQVVRN